MQKKHSMVANKVGPLLDKNNLYTNCSKDMANILSDQYKSVFSDPTDRPTSTRQDKTRQTRQDKTIVVLQNAK